MIYDKIRAALEEEFAVNVWEITDELCHAELETDNSQGEDVIITYTWQRDDTGMNLREATSDAYYNFDEDEYVLNWLQAKKDGVYGVPSATGLVRAAQDNSSTYERIAEIVSRAIR